MGRSNSCLKIITCGSGSADHNDLDLRETKASNDKRGWSFRKRSAQHRVLSNNVTSETPSSGRKESAESASNNLQSQVISTVPAKTSLPQPTDEKPIPEEAKLVGSLETIVVAENDINADVQLDEPVIIVLQTAVRGFLAQRELLRFKNVIKLQAAVRGHLVRRHAVGSLRCVQAICKMQALVRARQARLSLEGSYKEGKLDGKHGSRLKSSGKENPVTYISIEKLLSNRFARQLMDSTPKDQPIHIKCDPSKPNSAWMWLERWMAAAPSPGPSPTTEPELITEDQLTTRDEKCTPQVEYGISSEINCESAGLKPIVRDVVVSSESEENLITYEAENFNFQGGHLSSSSRDNLEQTQLDITSSADLKDPSVVINSVQNPPIQFDGSFENKPDFLPSKPEMDTEQPKQPMKQCVSDQQETETKKSVFASMKVSNPAFIAAQTKFEVLSSTANSGKSISSNVGGEPDTDTVSSGADTVFRGKDLNIAENTAPKNTRVQVGTSECGTELSISSTLDSPDISEAEVTEYLHEAKVSKDSYNPNSRKNSELGAKDAPSIPLSDISQHAMHQPEKHDNTNDATVTSVMDLDSSPVNLKPERSGSDLQQELVSETSLHVYRSSPEASPRSHMTSPESQTTPSSQVSVKPKRNKTDKNESNRKYKPSPAGKRSPSSLNHDSGARSSTEQLPKDKKGGKRHSSVSSVKPDQADQEPRDSSSSLPHFMQPTESVRAKLNANNSPRSSPDMQDRDLYIKKRHSLPGSNRRQGSPRIQRSLSQAQQGAKGNGTNSNERKWQR